MKHQAIAHGPEYIFGPWAARVVPGRKYAVLWIVAIQGAFQVMISFTSAQFVGLVIGGVTFVTIAGSLIYPTLELGQNYLSEFYGVKVSRTSVNAQLLCRIITALLLAFLFLLPFPPGFEKNNEQFLGLNMIVPRVAVASIIATWITGLVMVYVYEAVRGEHRLDGGEFGFLRGVCLCRRDVHRHSCEHDSDPGSVQIYRLLL